MSPAVDVVERLVIQRKLRHRAHAVLQYAQPMPSSPGTRPAVANSTKPKALGGLRAGGARDGAVLRASQSRKANRYRGPHRLMPELAAPRASQLSRMRMPQMARSRPSRASLIQRHRIGLA